MNRLRHLTLFAIVTLGLAACQGPQTNNPGPTPLEGIIAGNLTDTSGATMPDQQVSLTKAADAAPMSLQAQAARVTTTDEHGRFAFDVAEPGEYTLTTLNDTTGALARVTVTRGADGSLTAGAVNLQAAELGAITGSVAGQGAGVMVYLAGTSFLALTDADGDFAITRVPAGAYRAIASINGIQSPARAVTVKAGETTTVTGALSLAPTITGVTPGYLMRVSFMPDTDNEARIHGSGFGATRGSSRVYYYDVEVPAHAITSWSDDEITVDFVELLGWYNAVYVNHPLYPLDFDKMAFRVETPAGSATSGLTGYFRSGYNYQARGELYEVLFMVEPLFVHELTGVPLSVNITNGRLVDSEGLPVTNPTSGLYDSWADSWDGSYFAEPDSDLPMIVTFKVDDPRFEPTHSRPVTMGSYSLEPSTYEYPGPAGEITGQLLKWDSTLESGVPVSDYSDFTFMYYDYPESEVTPAFEPDGSFTVLMPIPADHVGITIDLAVLYQGIVAGGTTLLASY